MISIILNNDNKNNTKDRKKIRAVSFIDQNISSQPRKSQIKLRLRKNILIKNQKLTRNDQDESQKRKFLEF
jgi:hypothetical protein